MAEDRLLYLMVVNGERHWMTLNQAGKVYDSGWYPVSIGGQVMDEDGKERDITDEERKRIADIADECSASK